MCSRRFDRPVRAPPLGKEAANDDEEFVPPRSRSEPALSRMVPGLAGKKAVIVTDDRDMKHELLVTKIVMDEAGLSPESGPMGYSDFFSTPFKADVLILRSSREFSIRTPMLLESLERFRKENPDSAVMVLTFEHRIAEILAPLRESGVVNAVETRPPMDDLALLRVGAHILGKLQPF